MTGERGRRAALLLAVGLVLGGLGLAVAAGAPPLEVSWALPWPLLVPLYVAATHLSLEFRRRESSVGITLAQLPLALGVVLVHPLLHLVARLLASAAVSLTRRQDRLKVTCNLGFASLEVGIAAFAVSLVDVDRPQPLLSVALLAGLLFGDVATMLSLNAVIRLLGMPVTRRQLVEPLVTTAVTSTAWTGFAILTLSAAWTDPWTLLLVVLLAAGLAVLYRAHRRLVLQQHTTEDLYLFVKDLGPVDIEQPEALAALEHVRELLHARHLHLTVVDAAGGATHRLSAHVDAAPRHEHQDRPALGPSGVDLREDGMRTPLMAGGTVLGVLTATQRVGVDRGFDMRDLRLLETVATELATALDRGRLLRDLGLAATTDPLTGLPNLSSTTAQLDALTRSGADVLLATVAVVPYREVNDTLGHAAGDELLREVATRLRRFAPHALVGRIGGARFAVAVPAGQDEDAAMLGLRLRAEVEGGPSPAAGVGHHLRLAVGCARSPEHGSDAPTLLRRAETAMHSARRVHGGPVVWEPAYEVQGQRRLAVVTALREALVTGGVGVAYQPKVRLDGGGCSGVEALARWRHPAMGEVPPEEFVPLAEASGLMALLTHSVLRQALMDCRAWQRPGCPLGVSVNVSADTLQDARFVTEVAAVLSEVGVAPGLLTLELTEDVVVDDPQLATERMLELRALGVRLSVDDFGTGYSSLTYLKGLPIDEVKIDKGFVVGLVGDPADQAVVRAVLEIAHTLRVRVVAEGVEHADQHDLLRRLGVDEVQGYLHAKPMAGADMDAWLDRGLSLPRGT